MIRTNIEILDKCVDGNVDKLTHLVGNGHDEFRKFCKIYRDLFREKEDIKCEKIENKTVFSIEYPNSEINESFIENISEKMIVDLTRNDSTTTINISVIN